MSLIINEVFKMKIESTLTLKLFFVGSPRGEGVVPVKRKLI